MSRCGTWRGTPSVNHFNRFCVIFCYSLHTSPWATAYLLLCLCLSKSWKPWIEIMLNCWRIVNVITHKMATAAQTTSSEENVESFVTCSICLCEFDGEIRKPKFLPCAHTLCLTCLKVLQCYNFVPKVTFYLYIVFYQNREFTRSLSSLAHSVVKSFLTRMTSLAFQTILMLFTCSNWQQISKMQKLKTNSTLSRGKIS